MAAPTVRLADLAAPHDAAAVVTLLDAYARDPFGDGKPLADEVRERLVPALREHPTTRVFLALVEDQPVGIATSFVGFSTFAAKPLINVHDLAVLPEARGKGVGRALLDAVEQHARATGCCRVTLEVLDTNARARGLYEAVGFRHEMDTGADGRALFYAKRLA